MGWPPIKLQPLTITYITSPMKSEPACAPSISSSPTTLQNWDTHVIRKTGLPQIDLYKIGANQNGLIMVLFLSKIWCPKSIFGVPLFSIDYAVPNLSQVRQSPNFIEGHPFKDIQGPVRLRRHGMVSFKKIVTTGFQFYSHLQCAPCQGLNFIEPHNLLKRVVPIL